MSKMMRFIEEQPSALYGLLDALRWPDALAAAYADRKARKVWILGSGTSLYAAMIVAELWEARLGIDAEAISSLEFGNSGAARALGPDTVVVGISQSGATFILVEAIRLARARGALTIGVTAEPGALLGAAAEFIVPTLTGPEDALGKTKGFTTTTFAACMLGLSLAGQDPLAALADVPDALAAVIRESQAGSESWAARLTECRSLFAIGSGALVAAAWEGGLKVLEVAKQVVVTKELEEMLHGPFNAVGPGVGFVLLAGKVDRLDRLAAFVAGVRALDLPLLTVAEADLGSVEGLAPELRLPALREPLLAPMLAVVPMQVLAEKLAGSRGLDPDTARYPFLYKILAAKSIYV